MERQLNSSRGYRSLTDWSISAWWGPSRCVGPGSGCQSLRDRRRPSSPTESTDGGQGPVRARSTPAVARPDCAGYARASGRSWATVTAASESSGDSGSAFPAYGPGLTTLATYFQAGHRQHAYQTAHQSVRSGPISQVLRRTLNTLKSTSMSARPLDGMEAVRCVPPACPRGTQAPIRRHAMRRPASVGVAHMAGC